MPNPPSHGPAGHATFSGGGTRRLLTSALQVATATGTVSLLAVVSAVLSARVLGPEGRGALVLVVTTATYAMLISSFGITVSGRVMLGSSDPSNTLSYYYGLGATLVVCQFILTLVLVSTVLGHSRVPVTSDQLVLATLYGGLAMIAFLLTQGLYGLGLTTLAALAPAVSGAVQLLAVACLAAAGVRSLWPYLAAFTLGSFAQSSFAVYVLGSRHLLVRPAFSRSVWSSLLVKGIPGIALSVGQAAVLRIDRIFVGFFLSAAAVGVYSVAATATDVVGLAPTALSQVLFHGFASRTLDHRTASRARWVSLAVACALAILLAIVAPVAVVWLVGTRFDAAILPLRVLLIAAVALASYQMDSLSLAARGSVWLAGFATLAGLLVVLVADFLLIPTFGLVGAAWASVLAYATMAVSARALMRR